MKSNTAAALSYLLGFVSGIFFLLTTKDSFVKFHAMQSTVLSIGYLVLVYVLALVPVLSRMVTPLLGLAYLIVWVVCMIKAYQNQHFKLPVIGDLAENFGGK